MSRASDVLHRIAVDAASEPLIASWRRGPFGYPQTDRRALPGAFIARLPADDREALTGLTADDVSDMRDDIAMKHVSPRRQP